MNLKVGRVFNIIKVNSNTHRWINNYKLKSIVAIIIGAITYFSCNNESKSITAQIVFSQSDYDYINDELSKLHIPSLDTSAFEFKYKFVREGDTTQPMNYNIFFGKIKGERFQEIINSIEEDKILIKSPISEKILFRLKIVKGDRFDFLKLVPPHLKETGVEINKLLVDENLIAGTNGYYYFQELTVYKDPNKTKRKFKEGKFIMIDQNTQSLLFFHDHIHY